MVLSSNIGIDLGTSSVIIYIRGQGIVLEEPSVVAIDMETREILAVGQEAKDMIGKTPSNINVIRPLREGVISDYTVTEIMIKYFIEKAIGRTKKRPRIAICVPSKVTEVEKKAVKDATKDAGASEVFVIEEPIAAAIGSGIDISRACGSIIVDIGAGTTDVAVISLGSSVVNTSLKIAGDNFDDAIVKYVRKKYNLLIGQKSAERLKIEIGTAYKKSAVVEMETRGRSLITGLPTTVTISSTEIYEALHPIVQNIIGSICSVLEKTPPELASDIYERGIILTGGGALLYGLDIAIKETTKVNTIIAEEAITCVAIGTGKYIEYVVKNNRRKKGFKYRLRQLLFWR